MDEDLEDDTEFYELFTRKVNVITDKGLGRLDPEIGDLRIHWRQRKSCDRSGITIMAQQVKIEDKKFTFRQWNPTKTYEEHNDPDVVEPFPIWCCPCHLAEERLAYNFREIIDFSQRGNFDQS